MPDARPETDTPNELEHAEAPRMKPSITQKRRRTAAQIIRDKSDEFRATGLRGIAAARAGPRCKSIARHSGLPCSQPAMANGRCYFHGGATPKGDNWHRPRFSEAKGDLGVMRQERKLRTLAKARAERVRKLAATSPEERKVLEERSRANQPSTVAERRRRKVMRRQNRQAAEFVQKILATDEQPPSDEMRLLDMRIRDLERQAAIILDTLTEGVFG